MKRDFALRGRLHAFQADSILRARWPVAGKVDDALIASSQYLVDRTHEFRVRIKAMMTPKNKKVSVCVMPPTQALPAVQAVLVSAILDASSPSAIHPTPTPWVRGRTSFRGDAYNVRKWTRNLRTKIRKCVPKELRNEWRISKALYHQVHQTIQRNKMFFANDALSFHNTRVPSVIVVPMCSLRRVQTESRLRTLYASLPWFCVQLDFFMRTVRRNLLLGRSILLISGSLNFQSPRWRLAGRVTGKNAPALHILSSLLHGSLQLLDVHVLWTIFFASITLFNLQKDAPPPVRPNRGLIYVASSFPPWQHVTLTTLQSMFDANGGKFPDNRDIMNQLKNAPETKKHMKKLMPFVQHIKVVLRQFGFSGHGIGSTVSGIELEVVLRRKM